MRSNNAWEVFSEYDYNQVNELDVEINLKQEIIFEEQIVLNFKH